MVTFFQSTVRMVLIRSFVIRKTPFFVIYILSQFNLFSQVVSAKKGKFFFLEVSPFNK